MAPKKKPSTTRVNKRQKALKKSKVIDKGGFDADGHLMLPILDPVSDMVTMKQQVRKYKYARKPGGGKQMDINTFGEFEKPQYMDDSDNFYEQHEYHHLPSFDVP